jgi:Cu-Zn family superoxide dismutase
MKLYNVLATFRRDLRTRMGATLIPIVSAAVLIAPAEAYALSAEATLYDTALNAVGKARLTQEGRDNVVVQVSVHDLPAGFHGFHVHAVG